MCSEVRRRIRPLGLLIASCCIDCSTTASVPRPSVFGHYVYDGRNTDLLRGTEELILNEDGTFSQLYIAPGDGVAQTHHGRWTYDEKAGRLHFSSLRSWENRDLLGF